MNIVLTGTRPAPQAPEQEMLLSALDARHVAKAMSLVLGRRVSHGAVERVHFPKSRPVQIHYRFDGARAALGDGMIGEWAGSQASEHAAHEIGRLTDARRLQLRPGDETGIVVLHELGLVLRRPGLDRRLPGLRLLHDSKFAVQYLAQLFGLPDTDAKADVALKAHRLGKRAVLFARFESARGTRRECYVRLRPVSHEGGREAYALHARIASALRASPLRVPRPLHFDTTLGAAAFTSLAGQAPGMASVDDASIAGHALAHWQTLAPPSGRTWTAVDEIETLKAWVWRIACYRSTMDKAFRAALERVGADLYCLPDSARRMCHRDFHEGQVIIDRGAAGLIDFDTCAAASAALDAGNYLAHMRLHALRTGADVSPASKAFLDAMGASSPSLRAQISVWMRAALLRLAAIYAFTSEPPAVIAALLREAAP